MVVHQHLAELDTGQARAVVERVLPDAPRLAYSVLRARIEQAAQDTDPAGPKPAAPPRSPAPGHLPGRPSGAAELCGLDLPEEPAQDAHDRIVALAASWPTGCGRPGWTPRSGRSSPR